MPDIEFNIMFTCVLASVVSLLRIITVAGLNNCGCGYAIKLKYNIPFTESLQGGLGAKLNIKGTKQQ